MLKKLKEYESVLEKYGEGKGLVAMPDGKLVMFATLEELLALTGATELFNKTAEDKFEYATKEGKAVYGLVTKEGKLKMSVKKIV